MSHYVLYIIFIFGREIIINKIFDFNIFRIYMLRILKIKLMDLNLSFKILLQNSIIKILIDSNFLCVNKDKD